MKVKRANTQILEGDMTPMIDMSFQLIAFLMVLVNFTAEDVNERIKLPESVLAKPPETASETPIVIQVTSEGTAIMAGQEMAIPAIGVWLSNERFLLQQRQKSPSDATVVIRADKTTASGKVQEVMQVCMEKQFDRFVLRAKEQVN